MTLDIASFSQQFNRQLDGVMARDRHRLIRQWRDTTKRVKTGQLDSQAADKALKKLMDSLEQSCARAAMRQQKVPAIHFPENLPISAKRELIADAIAEHQVVVLAGETGSGKTTQIPKICLSLGRGIKGMIGHTQPRRLAARTVADRIAEELHSPLGESVGYQVRFTDHSGEHTHIKLMTDGILLAEIQNDRYLNKYDTLIIDEAHERSLNIDFLLGYIKTILPKRPDLKVIITSATIDLQRFSQHFDDCPIIEVSGRTYPVEVHYRPPGEDQEQEEQSQVIVDAIDELLLHERSSGRRGGDILVFLSGEREIRETALAIRKAAIPQLEILPLYARLSLAEQTKVFRAHKGRRVVLATNVAETSITVPGIRYVIDPGFARISRYSYRTKVQRLPVEAISQASANQRMGRCGRVSEGVCIRLYSEQDFAGRPEFTDAEILRTNLAAVILQMLQMRIGTIAHFPFVDSPDSRLVNDGFKLLQELQAVLPSGDGDSKLTPLGRQLIQLPLDPRLARMVLAGKEQGCLRELLIIVSALSVQDPRERPSDKKTQADQKHARFKDENSDFSSYLNLWNYFEEQRQALSQNQLRKQCKREFLSYLRLREWRDIHHQLRLALKDLAKRDAGFKENSQPADYQAVHRALLAGLLGNLGFRKEEREYLGARNRSFHIFPGSGQHKKAPKWLVAGELLETARLYAHNVAKIEPEWALAAAEHLVKRHHFEPHYNSRSGQVMAFEKISLYGLVLIEKQRVNFSAIEPHTCREVFIRSALVEGKYAQGQRRGKGKFFSHNQTLLSELGELEAKSRRRDIVADEQVLYDFYAERIPAEVINLAGFEHWRKQAEARDAKLLFIEREDLMQHDAREVTEAQFPNQWQCQGMVLPLSYHFEPNHPDDGVSLHVPVSILHQLPEAQLTWLVPGMLRDKCIALVKSLPKQWRKNFVPVPGFVDKALAAMQADDKPLIEALTFQLKRQTGLDIPPSTWGELDDYYRFNLQIVDPKGKRIDSGRDLLLLRERYRDHVQQSLQSVGSELEVTGVTDWSFGELPETTQLERAGVSIRAYPALVEELGKADKAAHQAGKKKGGSQSCQTLAVKLLDNLAEARVESRRGMARLISLQQSQAVKYLRKEILKGKDMGLSVAAIGNRDAVADDCIMATIAELFLPETELGWQLPRQQTDFEACLIEHQEQLLPQAIQREALLVKILAELVAVKKSLKQQKNTLLLAFASADINAQIGRLLYPGFLYHTPLRWLQQYPRYFKAICSRLERVANQVQKDKLLIAEVEDHWQRYEQWCDKHGAEALANQPLQEYRWMLEELRVSLFAQSLKTLMPISSKRLNKQWQLVEEVSGRLTVN